MVGTTTRFRYRRVKQVLCSELYRENLTTAAAVVDVPYSRGDDSCDLLRWVPDYIEYTGSLLFICPYRDIIDRIRNTDL